MTVQEQIKQTKTVYGIFMKSDPETSVKTAYQTFSTIEKARRRLDYWDGMSGPDGVEVRPVEVKVKSRS